MEKKAQTELIKKIKKLTITLAKVKLNVRLYVVSYTKLTHPTKSKKSISPPQL